MLKKPFSKLLKGLKYLLHRRHLPPLSSSFICKEEAPRIFTKKTHSVLNLVKVNQSEGEKKFNSRSKTLHYRGAASSSNRKSFIYCKKNCF